MSVRFLVKRHVSCPSSPLRTYVFANVKLPDVNAAVLNLRSEVLPEVSTRAERVRAHHLRRVGLHTLLPSLRPGSTVVPTTISPDHAVMPGKMILGRTQFSPHFASI